MEFNPPFYDRRGFLAGVGVLLAAPAIVRAGSIMPVHSMPLGATQYPLWQRRIVKDLARRYAPSISGWEPSWFGMDIGAPEPAWATALLRRSRGA